MKQEILKRAESRSGLSLVRLQPFDSTHVRQLDNMLGINGCGPRSPFR